MTPCPCRLELWGVSVVLRAEMCRIPTVAEPAEKAYLL